MSRPARPLLISAIVHGVLLATAAILWIRPVAPPPRAAWVAIDIPAADLPIPAPDTPELLPVTTAEQPEPDVPEPVDVPTDPPPTETTPQPEAIPLLPPDSPRPTAEVWLARIRPPAPERRKVDAPQRPSVVVQPSPFADRNLPPGYPKIALRRRWEGTVVVLLAVGADGTVRTAQVVESSGHACLDEAARISLASWRFTPGSRDGRQVELPFRQPVVFRIRR
ncbi:MAG: energy transducer TonB [Planctomycetes bacterium]|nr:energy transducer TonB [Planctomycetota bacterium]